MMGEWWDEIFDERYLLAYLPRQDEELSRAQALGAVRLADAAAGAMVLDMPCGYGRHSHPLAEAGYRVVGADRSSFLLGEARTAGRGCAWPRFVRADFLRIPVPAGAFDVVLNLFSSFGYFGDDRDREMLSEFLRVLRPSGRLVLEMMHRDRLARTFQPRGVEALADGAYLISERRFDLVTGFVEETAKIVGADRPYPPMSWRLRVFTATELVELFKETGFVDIRCYGDLEGAEFAPDTRLAVVARAPR